MGCGYGKAALTDTYDNVKEKDGVKANKGSLSHAQPRVVVVVVDVDRSCPSTTANQNLNLPSRP